MIDNESYPPHFDILVLCNETFLHICSMLNQRGGRNSNIKTTKNYNISKLKQVDWNMVTPIIFHQDIVLLIIERYMKQLLSIFIFKTEKPIKLHVN